jgi:hypothetical protein
VKSVAIATAMALLVSGCQSVQTAHRRDVLSLEKLPIEQLWLANLWLEASAEFHCRGLSTSEIDRIFRRKYAAREERITIRLGRKAVDEIIAIGHRCSYWRGALKRYEQSLIELEKRLAIGR